MPRIERLPQKLQIKFITKLAKKIIIRSFLIIALLIPIAAQIGKMQSKIGKEQISQFASIFAKIKVSKFSTEFKICSIVPSSKSFFRNSAAEKIKQESRENQIIVIE